MEKYTRYLRDCTNIPEDLYYDLFASMCDADMQKKLENIKGIKKISHSADPTLAILCGYLYLLAYYL